MTPTAVSQVLKQLVVEEQQPDFIWGSPGTGKSSVVNQPRRRVGNRVARHSSTVARSGGFARSALRGKGRPITVGNAGVSSPGWSGDFISGRVERRARHGPGQLLINSCWIANSANTP